MIKRRLVALLITVFCSGLVTWSGLLVSPATANSIPLRNDLAIPQAQLSLLTQTPDTSFNNLAIFYNQQEDNRLFVKPVDPTAPSAEVLSAPIFRKFQNWDWSDKAGTFVASGEYGLYTYIIGDSLPQLFLDAYSVGYLSLGPASWLPDGKSILFVADYIRSNQQDHLSSLMIDVPGQPPKLLLGPISGFNDFSIHGFPQWSPDGKYIAFTAVGINGEGIELFPINCAAGNDPSCLQPLTVSDHSFYYAPGSSGNGEGFGDPSWSPDGKKFAFSCSLTGMCLLDYSNGTFTHFKRMKTQCHGQVAWTPDSKYFVCASGDYAKQAVEVVNVAANTSLVVATMPKGSYDQIFAWLPSNVVTALESAPTPVPSPTMSQMLELQGLCHATDGIWSWLVTNPNPEGVPFVFNLYDLKNGDQNDVYKEEIPAAKNGIPATLSFDTLSSPDQTLARLYVNGVLQAQLYPNNSPCPTGTPASISTAQISG